ncbi:MAG: GAF domain-containing protein, partial [Deferribacterota bacterium]|nr:GAF domain-containing protein [Deferribacterota bacterium]
MNPNHLQLYSALLETNRLLLKEKNIEQLYSDFCKIIVESGEFNMAWVGVPDDVTIFFKSIAYYAKDEKGLDYLKNIEVSYVNDVPIGKGMSGKAFRDKKPYVVNDFFEDPNMQPWKNQAKIAGFASAAAFPIMYDDNVYAVFTIYSLEPNYFNEDVIRLLSELSTDIGFAIYHIQTQNKLKHMEERWRIALENSDEGVWDWECQTGKVYYSKKWKEMLGYNEDEIKDSIDEFNKRVHPDDFEKHNFKQMKCISGITDAFENIIRLKTKDGSYKWILSRGRVVERDEYGSAIRLLGVHIDISPFKESEEKILKINRLYDTLYKTNQLIIRVKGRKTLFKNICKILIENVDIELALVAIPEKNNPFFNVVSYSAKNKNGLKYLKSLKISPLETMPEGKGPAGKAYRLKKYVITTIDDPDFSPWRQSAIACNYNEVCYFPLLYKNRIYGVMGVYSSKSDYFDESIIKLIENLTQDVAFALYRIALEEEERALKKDLMLANNIYENSQEGIVLFDRYKKIISVNKTFEKLSGYKK